MIAPETKLLIINYHLGDKEAIEPAVNDLLIDLAKNGQDRYGSVVIK